MEVETPMAHDDTAGARSGGPRVLLLLAALALAACGEDEKHGTAAQAPGAAGP